MSVCTADIHFDTCAVAPTPDKKYILSVGGDQRILVTDTKSISESEGGQVKCENLQQPISCVASEASGDNFVIGTEQEVQLWSYPSLQFKAMITRFSARVSCVAISPDNKFVAAGCEDGTIRRVLSEDAEKCVEFSSASAPVHCVAFDPQGEYVAAAFENGVVQMFNAEDETDIPVISGVLPKSAGGDDAITGAARIAWHPDGNLLAIPNGHGVELVSRGTWTAAAELSVGTATVYYCAWSKNGLYLACITDKGTVFVWDCTSVKEAMLLSELEMELSTPLGLMWHPSENEVVAVDASGSLHVAREVIAKGRVMPTDTRVGKGVVLSSEKDADAPKRSSFLDDEAMEDDVEDDVEKDVTPTGDDVADSLADFDVGALGDDTLHGGVGNGGDGDGAADNADGSIVGAEVGGADDFDDYLEAEPAPKAFDPLDTAAAAEAALKVLTDRLQPPFMPSSSTPVSLRRYLCWNPIGTVVSRLDEDGRCATIEVDFADVSTHKNLRITDHNIFTMATLSDEGLMCALEEIDGNPSIIHFRPFDSWAHNAEWVFHLPQGESCTAIAVGSTFAAAATSRGHIRIFSIAGLQTAIMSVARPVVSMVAGGSTLAVFSQDGLSPCAKSQSLRWDLYDAAPLRLVSSGSLPLTPTSRLTWAGVSDAGQVYTCDSSQILRVLLPHWNYQWAPVLDIAREMNGDDKEAAADCPENARFKFWMVGVSGPDVMGVRLRKAEKAPPVLPRPLLQPLKLKLPLLDAENKTGELEQRVVLNHMVLEVLRHEIAHTRNHPDEDRLVDTELGLDKMVLRLFEAACKADSPARALDLAKTLHLEKCWDAASQIAQMCNMPTLASRIDDAKYEKFYVEDDVASEGNFGYDDVASDNDHQDEPRERDHVSLSNGKVKHSKISAPRDHHVLESDDRSIVDEDDAASPLGADADSHDVSDGDDSLGDLPPQETNTGRLGKAKSVGKAIRSSPRKAVKAKAAGGNPFATPTKKRLVKGNPFSTSPSMSSKPSPSKTGVNAIFKASDRPSATAADSVEAAKKSKKRMMQQTLFPAKSRRVS